MIKINQVYFNSVKRKDEQDYRKKDVYTHFPALEDCEPTHRPLTQRNIGTLWENHKNTDKVIKITGD